MRADSSLDHLSARCSSDGGIVNPKALAVDDQLKRGGLLDW